MQARRILILGFALSAALSATSLPAALAPWDVGIRDGYLRGIGHDDVWSAARAIGVDKLEVSVNRRLRCPRLFEAGGAPYRVDTPAARDELKARLAEEKIDIAAFCAGHNFDGGRTDEEALEWLEQIAEAAKDLGVPVIMVPVPGGKGMSDEAFMERGKKFLFALVPIAERTGVHFALENLQLFWNRVEVLEPVLQSLPTDKVGLAHDVTNMYWYGHPIDKIYGMTETIAPYVRHYCHAKNESYPADKKNVQREPGWEYGKYANSVREGDIDFRRILDSYAKAGWRGLVTIEDDSLGHHDAAGKKKVLIDDVKYLREIIADLEKKYN
jgi:sugar phosphate isomerase/epimerase